MGAKINITTHMLGDKRVGTIEGQKTLSNDETIAEAIDYGYVVGKKELVSQSVKGVLKAMADGVSKDGNGRKIDEYLSLQAYAKGRLDDITDDIDRDKLDVRLVARALKELKPDVSGWSFIVEGTTTSDMNLTSITTGETVGVIRVGEAVDINGFGLSADYEVGWKVSETGKSGTVAAAKVTGDWTRLTIAGDALAELNTSEYDGKTIVFTVRNGTKFAKKSAELKTVA